MEFRYNYKDKNPFEILAKYICNLDQMVYNRQVNFMASVRIYKDTQQGKIVVAFSYDPKFVAKVKSIVGYRWHPDRKYWSFPNSDGTLAKILKIF